MNICGIEKSDDCDTGLDVPPEKMAIPLVRFKQLHSNTPSRSTKQGDKQNDNNDTMRVTRKSNNADLRPVLNDLNLDIYPGQKVAIVGPSVIKAP